MREQSQPQLIDRRVREEWEADGATDMYTRASAKAREIIEDHKPEPLPDDVAKQMRRGRAKATGARRRVRRRLRSGGRRGRKTAGDSQCRKHSTNK